MSWAFTELVAAILSERGDLKDLALKALTLAVTDRGDPGAVTGLDDRIDRATDEIRRAARSANALPDGHPGDIRLDLSSGVDGWVEVKAQWTKASFRDLIQADWIRDQTFVLRHLVEHDRHFVRQLQPWAAAQIRLLDLPDDMSFAQAWLSDFALLTSLELWESAEIEGAPDLPDFMSRKWLVHWTKEGVRACRLDAVPAVAAALDGARVRHAIERGGASDAIVRVWVDGFGGPDARDCLFTYYVGYRSGVLGRHKVTPRLIPDSACTIAH